MRLRFNGTRASDREGWSRETVARLVRIPAIFTAPCDVLLGLALVASVGTADAAMVALLIIASGLIYAAGMAANGV